MRKVWIVVANSSEAKIYRAENVEHLVEHSVLFHDESRLPGRELASDRPGREQTPRAGSDTYDQKTSPKEKESLIFAEILARFLEKEHGLGHFERLYLVAKPPFIGRLHQALSPQITSTVHSEIHKDLTQEKAQQIRDYLPPVL